MRTAEKKPKKPWQKILLILAVIVISLVAALLVLVAVLFATEYQPEATENIEVVGEASETLSIDDSFTILTFNTGYGSLGDNADFFLDGGSSVKTADKERVLTNMDGIAAAAITADADIAFFQEVDVNSMRSNRVDEAAFLRDALSGMESTFAYNYRSIFIPYPIPPIGQVNAGILTMSRFPISDSTRVQLPVPFSGIERLGNLKRCLLVDRVPVEGSEKELVLVNLHLEAYDSGEGKAAQTAMLRDLLQEELEKGNYVIAGGDFNQIFSNVDSSAFPVYEGKWQPGVIEVGDFADGWQFLMDSAVPSCRSLDQPYAGADPSTFQFYIIDGFLVSPNLTVESVAASDLSFVSSDHNPVVMRVTLNYSERQK